MTGLRRQDKAFVKSSVRPWRINLPLKWIGIKVTSDKLLSMKKMVAILLILLALIMIYLSVNLGALPPGITGVGFILIALVFLRQ